jgi:hypothetical protein
VRGRAPDAGDGSGEGRLLILGEDGGVRVGGVSVSSELRIIVLSKAFSKSPSLSDADSTRGRVSFCKAGTGGICKAGCTPPCP